MNEQDCNRTYRQLEDILNEFNLQWVAQQVSQTIRDGKNIEESQEEYSAQEQLLLLIDAIEQIGVNKVDIEREISDFLSESVNQTIEDYISFYPSDEGEEEVLRFSPIHLEEKQGAAEQLMNLLNNLRDEVNT